MSAPELTVEIAFGTAESQSLLSVSLPPGASVADAIAASDIATQFPDIDFNELQAGVWGERVARSHRLRDGDRVEIYRPLLIDPMQARRIRATGRDPDPHGPR